MGPHFQWPHRREWSTSDSKKHKNRELRWPCFTRPSMPFALPPQASPADTSADVARRSLESPSLAPAGSLDTDLGPLVNEAIALGHGYPTQTINTELNDLPIGIRLMLVGGHRGPERIRLARPPPSRSERTCGLRAASTSELSTRYPIPSASYVERLTRSGP